MNGDLAEARGRAPTAGTYWYVVAFPPRPGYTSTLSFEASHVSNYPLPPSPEPITLSVFEDERVHVATRTGTESTVELPDRGEQLPRYLLRVSTTRTLRFVVSVYRRSVEPEPVSHPPCDPDNIDPSNPKCEGWHPRCDLENPDFKNPNCCQADCSFGRMTCTAKVLSGTATSANVAIGANKRIMRWATGRLFQDGKPVSDILVLQVEAEQSFVKIMKPKAVDVTKLLTTSEVILSSPEACKRW
ncbi:MAG: hypothetical protein WKG01_10625 [Kofleriaceae bacterium]